MTSEISWEKNMMQIYLQGEEEIKLFNYNQDN